MWSRISRGARLPAVVVFAIAAEWGQPALATVAPVQSPARPFGLDIVGPVHIAGSDAASADFQANHLPGMSAFVTLNLGERQSLPATPGISMPAVYVDPSQLVLATDWDVRAYFVGEGAGYHNTLGFNTAGLGAFDGSPQLIFPDASSHTNYLSPEGSGRTLQTPLMPGDYVELGRIAAGTHLDFFLIANGVFGGTNVYSSTPSYNSDGLAHAVSLNSMSMALQNSAYLVFGFEDLWNGGDLDYNDVVFAVDLGEENVAAIVSTPEPGTLALLSAFSLVGAALSSRRQRHAS